MISEFDWMRTKYACISRFIFDVDPKKESQNALDVQRPEHHLRNLLKKLTRQMP